MSIRDSILSLVNSKSHIIAAIRTKNGTVAAGDGYADFAADIATIPQLNTSDATATRSDILLGKTAYVKGVKILGNMPIPKTEQTKTVSMQMSQGNQTVTADSGHAMTSVTLLKPSSLIPQNIKSGVTIAGVTGSLTGEALPTLHPPTAAISGDILTITDSADNGDFVDGYDVFDGASKIADTTPVTQLSLSGLGVGVHYLTAVAKGTHFNDSANSNTVVFGRYSVTAVLTHCQGASSNPQSVIGGDGATLTVAADEDYLLPAEVSVSGASYVWNTATGALTLSDVSDNVTVTVTAIPRYAVSTSLSNCFALSTNPQRITSEGGTFGFCADSGFELPETVTVSGANYAWSNIPQNDACYLTIYDVTGDVTISVTATLPKLATPSVSLSGSILTVGTVANALSYALKEGNVLVDVLLPSSGQTSLTVDLDDFDLDSGTHTLSVVARATGFSDSDPAGPISYTCASNPLSTPAISISGDTLTITLVPNATSYDVYSDNALVTTVNI